MLAAGRSRALLQPGTSTWLCQQRQPLLCRAAPARVHASSIASDASQQQQQQQQVVVVGGGAAGLTAAYFAAKAGAKVTVLERMQEAGKKILMSGGTRCNVLPLHVDVESDFFTESSSSALRAVFASWSLEQCRHWLEHEVGIPLAVEEATNKLFPRSNSSREVRDTLLKACLLAGVEVRYGASLEGLERVLEEPMEQQRGSEAWSVTEGFGASSSGRSSSGTRNSAVSSSGRAEDHASSSGAHSNCPNPSEAGKSSRTSSTTTSTTTTTSSSSSNTTSSNSSSTGRPPGDAITSSSWMCHIRGSQQPLHAQRVVLATGGLSFPAVGTDGTGHVVLRGLGVRMAETYPALTPLTGRHPGGEQLPGLSLDSVAVECSGISSSSSGKGRGRTAKRASARRTGFLCTHKGFSGPAVLDVSHYVAQAHERQLADKPVVRVNWTGDSRQEWESRLQQAAGSALVRTVLQRSGVKERLAAALCAELELTGVQVSQMRKEQRAALLDALTGYPLQVTGHEGYRKAEVTGGGVPLSEVNCSTMELRSLPGVYLCGELLDVFGRIGGFNFLFAWLTGRLAGLGAAGGGGRPQGKRQAQNARQL